MTWTAFILVLIGVLLNAAAQFLLKAGVNSVGVIALNLNTMLRSGLQLAINPYVLGGLSCYVVSVVVWLLALSRVQVSIAYPMLSIGYIVTALAAYFFLGETMTPIRWAGVVVIIVGVVLITWK
ncbi:MAG: EamA family transporter [Gammaproteobacteria bacterium]|nr:EamA family transporter [Gammaproteobacteria bacterium]